MARTVEYKKTSTGTEYCVTSDGRPRLRKTNPDSIKPAPASVAPRKKQIAQPKPIEDDSEEVQVQNFKPDGTLGDLGLDPFTARLELQNAQDQMKFTITGFFDDVYNEGHPYTKEINDRVEEVLIALNDCSEDDIDLGKSAGLMTVFVDFSAGKTDKAVSYGKQVATVLLYLDYDLENCEVRELETGLVEAVFHDVGFKRGSEYFAQEVPKAVVKAVRESNGQNYLPGERLMPVKLGRAKYEYDEKLQRVEEDQRKKAELEAALQAFGESSQMAEGATKASLKDNRELSGEAFSDDGDSLFGEKEDKEAQIPDRAVTSKRKVDDYLDGLPTDAEFASGLESSLPPNKVPKRNQHIGRDTEIQSNPTKPAFKLALPPVLTQPPTDAHPIQGQLVNAAGQSESGTQAHVLGEPEEQKGQGRANEPETRERKEKTHRGKQRKKTQDQVWTENFAGTVERQFIKGKNGPLPIPFNEEVVAKQQDLSSAFTSEQMRAWLQIHGQVDRENKTKFDLEGQMEALIAREAFRDARNGDLFPSGYTSVKQMLSPQPLETDSPYQDKEHDDRVLLALSVNLKQSFGRDVQSAGPEPGSYAGQEWNPQGGTNHDFRYAAFPVPSSATVPAQPRIIRQTTSQHTQLGRNTSQTSQAPVAVPIVPYRHDQMREHYGKPANHSRAKAWFDPADVPSHHYTPGTDLELDMKVVRVDYGYSKDAVWSPKDNDDVTLRRVVTLIEAGGHHVLTAGQIRGILRSFGQQHIRSHTKKDECRNMLLAAPQIIRGLQILSAEKQGSESQQTGEAAMTVQQQQSLTQTQEVIDLTGEDNEEWTLDRAFDGSQEMQPQPGWNQATGFNAQQVSQSHPAETWAIVPEQLPQYDAGQYGLRGTYKC